MTHHESFGLFVLTKSHCMHFLGSHVKIFQDKNSKFRLNYMYYKIGLHPKLEIHPEGLPSGFRMDFLTVGPSVVMCHTV